MSFDIPYIVGIVDTVGGRYPPGRLEMSDMPKNAQLADGSVISIESIGAEWSPEDGAYRQRYAYAIVPAGAAWRFDGNDIRSGCGAGVDTANMLRTLASFLGAAAESYAYGMRNGGDAGENADLFPAHVTEWAHGVSDELSMLAEDPAERMRELGAEAGRAAGSWVVDGNSSVETLRHVASDEWEADTPAPLSGEWADAPLPRDVLAEVGVAEDDDEADDLLSEYENAYYQAYADEAQRSAAAMLPDDDTAGA